MARHCRVGFHRARVCQRNGFRTPTSLTQPNTSIPRTMEEQGGQTDVHHWGQQGHPLGSGHRAKNATCEILGVFVAGQAKHPTHKAPTRQRGGRAQTKLYVTKRGQGIRKKKEARGEGEGRGQAPPQHPHTKKLVAKTGTATLHIPPLREMGGRAAVVSTAAVLLFCMVHATAGSRREHNRRAVQYGAERGQPVSPPPGLSLDEARRRQRPGRGRVSRPASHSDVVGARLQGSWNGDVPRGWKQDHGSDEWGSQVGRLRGRGGHLCPRPLGGRSGRSGSWNSETQHPHVSPSPFFAPQSTPAVYKRIETCILHALMTAAAHCPACTGCAPNCFFVRHTRSDP